MISKFSDLLKPTKDAKQLRTAQKKLKIIREVYRHDGIAVNDLIRKLNLSFPTVNSILVELIEQGIILPTDRGESFGGRKPNLYNLSECLFQILCVEIQIKSIKISLIDNNTIILKQAITVTSDLSSRSEGLLNLANLIKEFIADHQILPSQYLGIAIAMPGLIDDNQGVNYSYLYDPDINLKAYFEQRFQKDIFLINDTKNATYAEQYFGALQQIDHGLTILMDWGMALGIVANGEVLTGKNGFSGEMGHINFIENGELCYCGKRGCLETVASGLALSTKARKDINNNVPTLITNKIKSEDILPIHIIDAALDGDQYAIVLINELGQNLGKAISIFIQIFNPEKVVLSGVFAKANKLITIPIQQQIQTYAMGRILKNSEIVLSTISENNITAALSKSFFINYLNSHISKD